MKTKNSKSRLSLALILLLIGCTVLALFSCSKGPASAEESTPAPSSQNAEPLTSETLPDNSTETLPEGAIEVYSGYPLLKYIVPGEIDMGKVEDGTWARYGYRAYVGKLDDKLVIMPSHDHGSSSATDVSHSEWYDYFNLSGGDHGVFLDGKKIIDAPCQGIMSTGSDKVALVFTTNGNESTVHVFKKETAEGNFEKLYKEIKLEGKLLLYFINRIHHYDPHPNDLYILTSTSVVVMKNFGRITAEPSDSNPYEMITLETPDWWRYIRPNSATMLNDGTIFVGSNDGVVGIKNGIITYYPIDFPKFIIR